MGCSKSKVANPLKISTRKKSKLSSYRWSISTTRSDDKNFLTADDRNAVEQSWGVLRKQGTDVDVGTLLFTILFEKMPKIRLFFVDAGMFSDPYELNWETDQRFRHHIRRVVTSISDMVDLIFDDELLEEYIADIAKKHKNIPRLEKHHYEAMMECLHEAVRATMGSAVTSLESKAWKKFLTHLYYQLTKDMPDLGKVD